MVKCEMGGGEIARVASPVGGGQLKKGKRK